MDPQRPTGRDWFDYLPWCAAGCFLACAGSTGAQLLTEWSGLARSDVFYFIKHVIVLWLIAASLIGRPSIGSLIAATWGMVVPLEMYGLLIREVLSGSLGSGGRLTPMDELRLLLLLVGTYLSFILAVEYHARKKKSRSGSSAKRARMPIPTASGGH